MLALGVLLAASLTGCRSGAPADLAGTSWKVTALTAPDGTTYDEASYDTLIGTTVYTFGEDGKVIINDKIKKSMDAYYEEYGVK